MPGLQRDLMGSGASGLAALTIAGQPLLSQTALGSSQATAFALTACSTEFTTTAASTGAILPANGGIASPGDQLNVYNMGANTLTVYPPVGGQINLAGVNTGVSVATKKVAVFTPRGDGTWFAFLSA